MKRAFSALAAVAVALLLLTLALAPTAPAAADRRNGVERIDRALGDQTVQRVKKLPTKAKWKRDVRKKMKGSGKYLRNAVAAAAPGETLAINLDIDNTMMASFYQRGTKMKPTWDLVGKARKWGVAVLVNTGRPAVNEDVARRYLRRGGYRGDHRIDDICLKRDGEGTVHSKKRCRAQYVAAGYRLVLNVGNNRTDFLGGDYDRAYRLPNYHHRLG